MRLHSPTSCRWQTFQRGDDPGNCQNLASAYDIPYADPPRDGWNFDRLVDIASDTGGLEVYFVNRFTDRDERETIALHCASGIVMSAEANGIALAHEIGHACGMHDLYVSENGCSIPLSECVRYEHTQKDWNGGSKNEGSTGSRYYASGTSHADVVRRLLMYGRGVAGKDIAYGDVEGVIEIDDDVYIRGFSRVGLWDDKPGTRSPQHQ